MRGAYIVEIGYCFTEKPLVKSCDKKRSREKIVPYLLSAKFFSSAVVRENSDSVSASRLQSFETAVKQVFEDITVVRVHGHPGVLLSVVDSAFC